MHRGKSCLRLNKITVNSGWFVFSFLSIFMENNVAQASTLLIYRAYNFIKDVQLEIENNN